MASKRSSDEIIGLRNSDVEDDPQFEEKLAAIKRVGKEKQQQRKKDVDLVDGMEPISYDEPLPQPPGNSAANNPLLKIGGGLLAVVLAALFLLGDILPQGTRLASNQSLDGALSPAEKESLQLQVGRFESLLSANPEDLDALEGLAVSYAELGDYPKAAVELELLLKSSPDNNEANRLLAEVYFYSGRIDDSVAQYRTAIQASPRESIQLLQGLVDALTKAGSVEEAVNEASRGLERVQLEKNQDAIPFSLLLGRALDVNNKSGEAIAVYDGLISTQPDDFRPYVAKAVELKKTGRDREANELFLQARSLAPDSSKGVVDRISKL